MIIARFGLIALSGFALLSSTGRTTTPSVPAGTSYDLRIDASLGHNQSLQPAFLIVVTPAPATTPAPAGSQIFIQGQLTFSSGFQFTNLPTLPGWTCNGAWAAFTCEKTLGAPLNNDGGYLLTAPVLPPQPTGSTASYTVSVSMTGNTDPDPTTDTYSFTHTF
jgi:hypothetical protein